MGNAPQEKEPEEDTSIKSKDDEKIEKTDEKESKPDEKDRSYLPWNGDEDSLLTKEYNDDKLDITKISEIHKRSRGSIISRLKKLSLIATRYNARGYAEYKKSDEYKAICAKGEEKKERIAGNAEARSIAMASEIVRLRDDIRELKMMISRMLDRFDAMYEYEYVKK
jgi:hypothetical protein